MELDDTTLAFSVPEEQREAVLRALEYERNPTEQNAEYVCEVMETLFKIKQDMKQQDTIKKRLDDAIKFAVRNNADKAITKQFFDIKPPRQTGKIENPVELFLRLMKIFDDPMDFVSCIEFNYKNVKELMGNDFIKSNADIITETEYASAVYLQ